MIKAGVILGKIRHNSGLILSNINVIAKRDLLTLDFSLHMERGKTGQWAVVSSFIKDVGSNQISHGIRPNTFKGRNMYAQN